MDLYVLKRFVGWILYHLGFKPTWSTSIADTPTAGYGELDDNGFWQYPTPTAFWRTLRRQTQ